LLLIAQVDCDARFILQLFVGPAVRGTRVYFSVGRLGIASVEQNLCAGVSNLPSQGAWLVPLTAEVARWVAKASFNHLGQSQASWPLSVSAAYLKHFLGHANFGTVQNALFIYLTRTQVHPL
jgi:hypothetical protein